MRQVISQYVLPAGEVYLYEFEVKYEMCLLQASSDHSTWNQLEPDHAPQPQPPEASEVTVNAGCKGQGNIATPFQWTTKVRHHCKSFRNSQLSLI